jgi:hypothetical protein
MLAHLSEYLVIEIFSFLEIVSLLRVSRCCKVWKLFVNEVCKSNPSMVISRLSVGQDNVRNTVLQKIQSRPSFALFFGVSVSSQLGSIIDGLRRQFPDNTKIVYIQTNAVQRAHHGAHDYYVKSTKTNGPIILTTAVGSFPDAEVTVFAAHEINFTNKRTFAYEVTNESLASAGMADPHEDWSVFILCFSHHVDGEFGDAFISQLQKKYPNSSIIGGFTGNRLGIAAESSFSLLDPGHIVVIGMKGNVPLKVVVSRGMEAISPECTARIIGREEGHSFHNLMTDDFLCIRNSERFNIHQHLLNHVATVDNSNEILLGVRMNSSGPYALKPFRLIQEYGVLFPMEDQLAEELLPQNGESPITFFRFFQLSPDACKRDLLTSLNLAKMRFAAEGLTPMSSLMFTCGARGPLPNPDFFTRKSFIGRQ